MEKSLNWRGAIIAIALVLAIVFLTPTLSKKPVPWWPTWIPNEKIHLGLDLQGGMHLILEVQLDKAVEGSINRAVEEIKFELKKEKIRYVSVEKGEGQTLRIVLDSAQQESALNSILNKAFPEYKTIKSQVTDAHVEMTLELSRAEIERIKKMAGDQALETIRNRVDQFGVSEPDIRPQGEGRILIQLPGVKEIQRAKDLIGRTAMLEFKLVDEQGDLQGALKGDMPPGSEILYEMEKNKETGRSTKQPLLVKKRSLMSGEYITDAKVGFGNQYNQPYVSVSFDSRGARLFAQITGEHVNQRLAIILDGNIYSAPVIREKIAGGHASIEGSFSPQEAHDLAIVLRAGALPAPVVVLEERVVGATLGEDSIRMGVHSMALAGILVILFMAIYYKSSGIIADGALLLNLVFILACLAAFRATLTMPGMAGIILTIGMSVDANVLINERIREEIRVGKTLRAAVEAGFSKAFLTILDANVTTLIAALVLFQFGTGPVRGFAITLCIGIVCSMFTAIFISRFVFDFLLFKMNKKAISI
ncbi:MAG: protein translocase subunit SecD [Deltaproteobacteria bacterium]|nr:protein translocase subunit SecD [Deltaproteobacteria bacterium]